MADDVRGRFLNRLFRRFRFSAERRANLFGPSWYDPDNFLGSRDAPSFLARPHLYHHTDFLLEFYAVLARTHGRAGHNKGQYKHGVAVFWDLWIYSRLVPAAAVAFETRRDFSWFAPAGWIRAGFARGRNRGTCIYNQIPRHGDWSHTALDGWNALAGV